MAGTSFKITSKPTMREIVGNVLAARDGLEIDRRDLVRIQGRRFVELAREEAPVDKGTFAKGIRWRSFAQGDAVGFSVSDPQPLGKWIRGGTKRHPIPLRPGGMLRFYWAKGPRGAGVYFFRSVNHPGTKPNKYVGRAYRRWLPGARKSLRQVGTNFARTITGSGSKRLTA